MLRVSLEPGCEKDDCSGQMIMKALALIGAEGVKAEIWQTIESEVTDASDAVLNHCVGKLARTVH
jgi:hypothetical protein